MNRLIIKLSGASCPFLPLRCYYSVHLLMRAMKFHPCKPAVRINFRPCTMELVLCSFQEYVRKVRLVDSIMYRMKCMLVIILLYRVSQEECARLREGVPYVEVYRYNPKHLCPKLNSYRDNGQRKVWCSCGSTYCTWFA